MHWKWQKHQKYLPFPWSSCQYQNEIGALVTWNPEPCHPHRKNTHLAITNRVVINGTGSILHPHYLTFFITEKSSSVCLPAPSGVMVPSLTASGYPVSWKWRRAWLLPPEPSKYLRPHITLPSVRFIQIFSWRSHTSHRQPLWLRKETLFKTSKIHVYIWNNCLLCNV